MLDLAPEKEGDRDVRGDRLLMPIEVHDRDEVRALIERGVQIVEVLGPKEFEAERLPGAVNIPLRQIETQALTLLERSRPVLVYCFDSA